MFYGFKRCQSIVQNNSGEGGEEVSIQELASNLSIYKDQLQQVRQTLNDDPANSDYVDMEGELTEVIGLTEELIATARQDELSGSSAAPNASANPSPSKHKGNEVIGFFSGRKQESIFKSPDDPQGKVGVIGSGKGLTDFQKREAFSSQGWNGHANL